MQEAGGGPICVLEPGAAAAPPDRSWPMASRTPPVGRAADNVLSNGLFADRLIHFSCSQSQKKVLRDCRLDPVFHLKPQQQAHETDMEIEDVLISHQ